MKWATADTPTQGRPRKPSMAPKSPHPTSPVPISDTIKAYVRVRPKGEGDDASESAVRMANATCEVTTSKRGRDTKHTFTYDDCFWSGDSALCSKPFASQESVFQSVGVPLVDNVMQGYNSAVIAYGQTGSGKTYSIFGPASSLGTPDEGLIPRVCSELFKRLQDLSKDGRTMWTVHMTMVEVYLEDVFDLLHHRHKLSIRGDCTQGFHVVGVKRIAVASYREIEAQLAAAESRKTFAATAIHERSSRAHTIFQLELTFRTESYTRSPKLVLADLAGSERIKIAKTDSGTALEQACNINLSLLALGNCIEAVMSRSKGEKTTDVGEFRTSTLTKLLKDHIGGNSRSAILVTISPMSSDAHLSLQALRFGDRAKHLQTHAKIIQTTLPDNAELMQQSIVQDLERRKELLEKERELRMQEISLDQRRADLERQSQQLLLAKAQLQRSGQQDYESRVKLIDTQLQALQQQLRDMQAQKDELDTRFLDVCADHQATLSDVQALQREVERLTAVLESQREEHADDLALQELELRTDHEAELENKDKEIAALRSTHESNNVEMTQHFVAKLTDAERRAANLQEQLDALQAQHVQLSGQLGEERSTTEQKNAAHADYVRQLRAEMDALSQAHQGAMHTAEEQRVALQAAHASERERREALERALNSVTSERDAHATQLRSLEASVEAKTAAEAALQEAMNTARVEHAAAIDASRGERLKVERELSDLASSRDDLGAEVSALRRRVQTLEDEAGVAARSLASAQEEKTTLTDSLKQVQSELAQTKSSRDDAQAEVVELKQNLAASNSEIEKYKSRVASSTARSAELESGLQKSETLCRNVSARLEEETKRAQTLSKDLMAATARESTLGELVDELRDDLDLANKDLENIRATQATNNRLYAEAQQQVIQRQERIFNLEGLLKATAAQLSNAEEQLLLANSSAGSASTRVSTLDTQLRSTQAMNQWMLVVTEGVLQRNVSYFNVLEIMTEELGKGCRRCQDDLFSMAMDKSVSMQKRISNADADIAALTAELFAVRKSASSAEAALREELSSARNVGITHEAQVGELRRTVAALESDLATARLKHRQAEQTLREELADLKRQRDAYHDEQSTTNQAMRQKLQEEMNYNDMLVQQCMAAQRALAMGLREASMRQPASARLSTASIRRTYDEEMTPRKEHVALRHFNPNLSGMLNDDTISENGTDVSAK